MTLQFTVRVYTRGANSAFQVIKVGPHELPYFDAIIFYVFFSYDLEENVTLLKIMILTLCKHTSEPT